MLISANASDITIDHCPDPPPVPELEDISIYTANAERCLQAAEAEKRKFTTMGNSTVTGNTMTREDVLRALYTDSKLLQIWAICPYGGMGPMLRRFLFGDDPIRPLSFTSNKPQEALEASLASFILEESASLEASPMQLGQLQPALEDNGGGMRSIRNIAKPHYYIVDGDSVELIDRDSIVESTVSHSVEHASSDDESSCQNTA